MKSGLNTRFLLCEVIFFTKQKDPASITTQGLISFFILFYFLIKFLFATGDSC